MADPFFNVRSAALALLTSDAPLREKEGQFLGGLAFRVDPLSDKQLNWLRILLDRHGQPPLGEGVDQ